MTTASGISKKLVVAPQVAQGTVAVQALATAQFMRRVTSSFDLTKETYQSNEMRADRQIGDFRHGVQSADGTIAGELSPGTFELLMAGILRRDFTTAAVGGPDSDVTAAITSGASGTFTSAATATFLTDGLKVGDVGRWTGFDDTEILNNGRNFVITALTELIMTGTFLDGDPVDEGAEDQAVTFTLVGEKTWTPALSHTEDWFTIEHEFSDLSLSEVFWDAKPNTMAFKLPASGIATIDIGLMALRYEREPDGTSPWFTNVVAASSTGLLASIDGFVSVGGTEIALLTGIDFDIAAGITSEGVVGSNVKPDLFDGRIQVKGNMTLFFESGTMRDYFADETEVAVTVIITDNSDSDSEFLAFTMPRVKMGGSSKDDGEKGIVQTMPFVALFNTSGDDGTTTTVDSLATTLSIQDSTL